MLEKTENAGEAAVMKVTTADELPAAAQAKLADASLILAKATPEGKEASQDTLRQIAAGFLVMFINTVMARSSKQ